MTHVHDQPGPRPWPSRAPFSTPKRAAPRRRRSKIAAARARETLKEAHGPG